MGLSDRARKVLGVLAEADGALYVSQVAARAEIPPQRAGAILFRLWQENLADRVWDGPRRRYPITDAGREQWAEVCGQG